MQWLKLNSRVFADSKIVKLRAQKGGNTCFTFWVQLLCLAAQMNMAGYLLDEEGPIRVEMLSKLTGFTQPSVKKMLQSLLKVGLLGFEDNTYFLPNWEKCQSGDRLEKLREADRKKKREQRARKRELVKELMVGVPGDVPGMSPPQNKNKEKEEEKETESENKKIGESPAKEGAVGEIKNKWEQVVDDYCLRFSSEEGKRVATLLYTWLDAQKAKGKLFTSGALTLNLEKIQAMAKASKLSVEAYLKEVVCRGWSGFYPIPAYQQLAPETKRTPSYNIEEVERILCGREGGE